MCWFSGRHPWLCGIRRRRRHHSLTPFPLFCSHTHRQQMSLVVIVFSARQQLEPVDKKRKSTACERLFTHTYNQQSVSQSTSFQIMNSPPPCREREETKRKHTHVDKKRAGDGRLSRSLCLLRFCSFAPGDAGRVDLHI